jgi:D-arabinose 1-dehydrogenase-like Zn-dependent alcohol dehydrogenase
VIDALGAGVVGWQTGQRVGVGWFGGMVAIVSRAVVAG